jgi:hypothetical protein
MLVLTADQQVTLTAVYTDKYGNTAPIDGQPTWETSVDGIVVVKPAEDAMSAEVITVGPIGQVQVRAIADALPGASEKLIIGILDIEVAGGEARIVTLNAGTAISKDDAPEEGPTDEDVVPLSESVEPADQPSETP